MSVALPWILVVAVLKSDLPYRDALTLVQFDRDPRFLSGGVATHSEPTGERRDRSQEVLRRAMRRYPPSMLTRHLRFVYVSRRLFQQGEELSGLYVYMPPGLCLAVGSPKEDFDALWLRNTFHHEFSHALYTQRPGFPRKEWLAQNAPGFFYDGSYAEASYDEFATTESLAEQGLVNSYAASEMAEDFAEVAERVMGNDAEFWRACRKYPRLAEKARLVVRFYQRVEPKFRIPHAPKDVIK